MRKTFTTFLLSLVALTVVAVPARRGQWKQITLVDGSTVKAQLVGDEHGHFWKTTDGRAFVEDVGQACFVPIDQHEALRQAGQRRAAANKRRTQMHKNISVPTQPITGKKKGLMILVQFNGETFEEGANANQWYTDMMNKEGFSATLKSDLGYSMLFTASVRDYFMAVSDGQLDLDFDVVGPVQLKNAVSYYGKNYNNIQAQDQRPEYMVKEACDAADELVNFADYDWNGDGEVEQVVIIYSGLGENAGGDANTIWAHEYWISYTGLNNYKPLEYDGMKVDTYACSPEKTGVYSETFRAGIGILCHEFSHCLGLPDMYDTGSEGNYGMYSFSIMDQGSYNGISGPGYNPAEYTAYERMYAGWRQPIELTENTEVSNLKPISKGGDTYIIYNDANRNEYFLLENRQHAQEIVQSWSDVKNYVGYFDIGLEGDGLLVTHVDFDPYMWVNNLVNTTGAVQGASDLKQNDHPRCQIVPADGSFYLAEGYDYYDSVDGDCFPYVNNVGVTMVNSLTDDFQPAQTWFNTNAQGDNKLHFALTDIKQNKDLTVSFKFSKEKVEDAVKTVTREQKADNRYYDLSGRQIVNGQPVSKGIYIRGGKKFVVK